MHCSLEKHETSFYDFSTDRTWYLYERMLKPFKKKNNLIKLWEVCRAENFSIFLLSLSEAIALKHR